ncbi:N-ethylmaleimide reductase [compost metagenome]
MKFLLEVVDACIEAVGAEKVAIRLSPYGRIQGIQEYPEETQTFQYIAKELSQRNISFVHLMNQIIEGKPTISTDALEQFRSWYNGVIIYAGGLDKESAEDLIKRNIIDLAAFGQLFISNPDLTSRMKNDQPLIPALRNFFYGGGKEGYIDYPSYQEEG